MDTSFIVVDLNSSTSSRASQEQPDPGQLIQLKKDTPAVIDGEVIGTSQAIVLVPDARCLVSGTERNITNLNNEESVKQRMVSSSKTKI